MSEESKDEGANCPSCGHPMRKERNGVRVPPTPGVFWFCADLDCEDGLQNRVFHGG